MNSKGVTLIELMVYVSLVGVIVVLMAKPMKSMLNTFGSSKKISILNDKSRDLIVMLTREMQGTGFKRYAMVSGVPFNSSYVPNTYLPDSSSIIVKQGNPGDTLTIYKATMTDNGTCTGGADSIKYYLNGTTLKRNYNGSEMELGQDVYALQFQMGLFTKDSVLFSAQTFSPFQWANSGVASSSIDNGDLLISYSGSGTGTVTSQNTFTTNSSGRVKLTFTITNKNGVPDNIDSLVWAVVNSSNVVLAKDKFKPGLTSSELILPLANPVSGAKIQFNAYCKSAASIELQSVEVRLIDRGSYVWADTVATKEKKNVKAIKTFVLLRSSGKTNQAASNSVDIANVTVPRDGPYTWRLLSEIVKIPNNGLF